MSGTDIAVTVLGLLLGYWMVSLLFSSKPAAPPSLPVVDATAAGTAPSPAGAPWHATLELPPTATPDEIDAAYRRLIGQYHPDKVATLGVELRELAERKSREIVAARAEALRSHGLGA